MATGVVQAAQALRQRMADLSHTNPDDWFLVAKARQGMQVALEAAGGTTGRAEVATQLFTCVTAVDPILCAGLTPRYVDVSPRNLAIDSTLLDAADNTCAVVLQRTFGIEDVPAYAALQEAAHAAGALLLEDAAHCVGRLARDEHGEPLADVSVHSFGVEKILFGTYFGGAVWVNPRLQDATLRQTLRDAFAALPPVDARLDKAARAYRNQTRVITRLPHGAAQALRSHWERRGTFEPAVSEAERRGSTNHRPSLPSDWMCEQALAALDTLDANESRRAACVDAYLAELADATPICDVQAQPLLRFPVFAGNEQQADAAIDAIAELGFYAPPWPRPLLVPGVLDPDPYGLAGGTSAWPRSASLSASIIALPTDIEPSRVPDVVRAVRGLIKE